MIETSIGPTVGVDYWADLTCPWCFVGLRRLADAVTAEGPGGHTLRWRAFVSESTTEVDEAVRRTGAEAAVAFTPATPVTGDDGRLAHRAVLMHEGKGSAQLRVANALFVGHFEQGRDIGNPAVVAELAAAASGADAEQVRRRLDAGEAEDRLEADLVDARHLGVTTVPTYVVAGRPAVQGAQPVDVLRRLLSTVREDDPAA